VPDGDGPGAAAHRWPMLESNPMAIEIRPARPEEIPALVDTLSGAFLERPDIDRVAQSMRDRFEPERTLAAFDGSRVCGTFRSWATELTGPGGVQIQASAVSAVSVRSTHRRRGILTRMAAAGHAALRELGDAVAVLYASEFPIYGRFGYGPGCRLATWTLDTRSTSFHCTAPGGVELVNPDEAGRDVARAVFEAWRVRQPGEIRRTDRRWDESFGLRDVAWGEPWKGFLAVRRDAAGLADGYVRFHADPSWEGRQPRGQLLVDDLHALTDDAYVSLWRFLAETDLAVSVTAAGRRASERLPWLLTDARAAVASELTDGMWVRLFDIPRVLGARRYEATGTVVIEVVDPELPRPTRVVLEGSPDGADCTLTDREPDLTLPVAALGAAYLGGTRLGNAVIGTGVDEHRPGALAKLDALLRTADEPWCSTFF